MAKPIIGGIQQIGIGNPDTYKTWAWYRKAFKIDIPIFDDAAIADLMLPYTGGEPRERHAVLAMSMRGGGGIEIWQYTERKPEPPKSKIQLGDLGIYIAKIKSNNIQSTYDYLKSQQLDLLCPPQKRPNGELHFYMKDLLGNVLEVVPSDDWYTKGAASTGGIYGCTIGVSDMDRSIGFYKEILGYDTVIYDESGQFEDLSCLESGQDLYRRVLLTHSANRRGPFSEWIGKSEIELIQSLERTPRPIFANRFWGLSLIHI